MMDVRTGFLPEDDPANTAPKEVPRSRVLDRLVSILGAEPTRQQLIAIVQTMGWGALSRTEKRVKQTLLARLDGMANQIFDVLSTEKGLRDLQTAFIQSMRPQTAAPPRPAPMPVAVPMPETTVDFYLN
jgi:hypothetical protein